MSYNDSYMERERQSTRRYTRKGTVVSIIIVVIILIAYIFYLRNSVDGPKDILSLNAENYHNVTSIVLNEDLDKCRKHLSSLEKELPDYIQLVSVVSDNGASKCISVKFAVSAENLKRSYFTDPKSFDEIVNDLTSRGIVSREELEEILSDSK